MTGTERMRKLVDSISPIIALCGVTKSSYDRSHIEMAGARLRDLLADIADQIERETKPKHHTAKYVSVSAYDPPSQEDRDASAWVREHGGLDAVRRRWECLSHYADPVPRSCMEKRLARLQRQIDESHAALRRRRETISELNHRACDLTRENAELRKRAMPEDKEWSRYKDGAPVNFDDTVVDAEGFELKVKSFEFHPNGFTLHGEFGESHWYEDDDRLDYPAPKVLDADGAEIREKRDVWWICEGDERGLHAERLRVETICPNGLIECSPYNGVTWVYLEPSELYVNKPVPASDGRPLREGETVWDNEVGIKGTVVKVYDSFVDPDFPEHVIRCRLDGDKDYETHMFKPSQLTHQRPVADTWERIEEDAGKDPCDYFGFDGEETCGKCPASGKNCEQTMARERECDADTIENLRLELGEARDEAAWVREHGGLDSVKKLLDWVVGHCSTRQQLDFDFWLSGRVMHELGFEEDMADRDEVERRLLARLVPYGMEWPTVDGKPVDFVTGYEPSLGVLEAVSIYSNGACEVMGHDGIIKAVKEIHVATPKALDADGAESGRIATEAMFALDKWADPKMYTHRAPVPASDGKPLREGEHVWHVETGREYVVVEPSYGDTVVVRLAKYDDAEGEQYAPDQLTHERPDSWERLERDANASTCTYFGATTKDCEICGHVSWECSYDKARDLVRRCRALAERGQ